MMMRTTRWMVVLGLLVAVVGLGLTPALAGEGEKPKTPVPDFAVADFYVDGDIEGDPFPIDNLHFPLEPGTAFFYEAVSEDEPEGNVVYVTHDTKVIAGVTCTVVVDIEWEGEGEDLLVVEYTEDWFAQDKHGNVWYLGEDTWAFEYDDDGEFVECSDEGAWEAGVDGAVAGILMLANPQPGDSYRQEYWEDEAEDMATVLRLNASASVEFGEFENCLVTKEWTPLERGNVEHKFYASGVGLVLINELKEKTKRVELIDIIGPPEIPELPEPPECDF